MVMQMAERQHGLSVACLLLADHHTPRVTALAMPRILQGPLRRALVVENPHVDLDGLLRDGGFDEVVRVPTAPDEQQLIALVRQHRPQVIFKRSRVPVTRAVLEAAEDLVAIQLCCIGDDSIDKAAAADHGVLVFNDPVSNGRSVVELVVGHLISLSRRLYVTWDETHAGTWQKNNHDRYEIRGKVLGIVGLGNIGRAVARVADGLGMEVLFHDRRTVAQEVGEEMGWEPVDTLEALFRRSDAVTLHVSANDPWGASNTDLIDAALLMQLGASRPQGSPRLFINLARGVVHSPEALKAAIDAGVVKRAAVDVYPDEPRNNGAGWDNPYAEYPQVATTPHIGAATQEAQPRIARRVATTSVDFSCTGRIRDCVFSPRTRIVMKDDLHGERSVLVVVHATTRGTKKALDDAIYESGADNLRSQHRDFGDWGIAVDVSLLDRPLSDEDLQRIVEHTAELTGDKHAVRLVRQVRAQ